MQAYYKPTYTVRMQVFRCFRCIWLVF